MKVVLFVPGRAQGSHPVLGTSWSGLAWCPLPGTGAQQAQRAPLPPRQPRPLGDMPRRATGGRQGGGTSWHHQTTAPGGRWQHKVEMPRAVQPKVRRRKSSAALPRHCQARGPEGPGPPPSRPPPPQRSSPTLPRPQLLPSHFLQLKEASERGTGALGALKPLSQLSQAGPPPRPGRSGSRLAGPVLTGENLSQLPSPRCSPAPSPITRPNAGLWSFSLTSHSGELGWDGWQPHSSISDRTLFPQSETTCRVGGVVVARVQGRGQGQSRQMAARKGGGGSVGSGAELGWSTVAGDRGDGRSGG